MTGEEEGTPRPGRRLWLAIAVVGALAAAGGYGVSLWLHERSEGAATNVAAVKALLAAPLMDLKGGTRALETWRGSVLVVNFWATWCTPCRAEIPEFVRMQDRYRAKGLQFVGVAFDQPQPVAAFAQDFRINYPVLLGGMDTMALMREAGNRAGVLPFTLVLDRQGNVAGRHPGVLTESKLLGLVQPLW